MSRRVPLALRISLSDRRRLALSLSGVTFAVVIILAELGFLNALLDAQVELLAKIDADVFIVSSRKVALGADMPFARRRVEQALACRSVASARPIWIVLQGNWRNARDHSLHAVRVLGVDPAAAPLSDPDLREQLGALARPDTTLIDRRSREEIGPCRAGVETELSQHRFHVAGTFDLGTDFVNDATLVMSDRDFLEVASDGDPVPSSLARVELGAVKLREGVELDAALSELRSLLPDDVRVLARRELVRSELDFWEAATPVGPIFSLGCFMGFVVGTFIVYQVLSNDVLDNLPQLATLKALGYDDRYLLRVVLEQSLILGLLGFLAGLALGALLYRSIDAATGIPMRLTLVRGAIVLALDLAMCSLSGVLAARRALHADPAEMFS
jgi:putative ABC transport system permease protein